MDVAGACERNHFGLWRGSRRGNEMREGACQKRGRRTVTMMSTMAMTTITVLMIMAMAITMLPFCFFASNELPRRQD
eukprot:2201194-Pyramimonas_sp.AAC.1